MIVWSGPLTMDVTINQAINEFTHTHTHALIIMRLFIFYKCVCL